MRKTIVCCLSIIAIHFTARAQDCCPKYEGSLKYSYFSSSGKGDGIISDQFNGRSGQNGFGASFAINRVRKFDMVADFGYQHKDLTIGALSVAGSSLSDARTKLSSFLFLFGPRLSSGSEGANFFVHALAGAIHRRVESTGLLSTEGQSNSKEVTSSSTDFALGFGGGADIKATKHLKVRLFQFDYIPSRVESDSLPGDHQWSHNYRLQAGIVIGWGVAK